MIAVRDRRNREDEGGLGVRSSGFLELRTPDSESRLSRMSRALCSTVYGIGVLYQQPVRVGEARTYRGQHRYGGDLGGTLGFPVKLGLHTVPTLDPLMNHIPSGR